jgi:cytochrome c heme-lyase
MDSINQLNMMPRLSQQQISAQQGVPLPTEREISSIPKASSHEGAAKWEYPSAQQLYNAMVRKGFEQSGEHVESMLSVHNFLNEGAWHEILTWERRRDPAAEPFLRRFTGRPATPTPKAWMVVNLMGGTPPFDRHDWYVARQDGTEARYVIDYYEGPDEEGSAGVYFLDIRPALDSPGAAFQRIARWTSETWTKAKGEGGRTE